MDIQIINNGTEIALIDSDTEEIVDTMDWETFGQYTGRYSLDDLLNMGW